jgi:hypothetical protein
MSDAEPVGIANTSSLSADDDIEEADICDRGAGPADQPMRLWAHAVLGAGLLGSTAMALLVFSLLGCGSPVYVFLSSGSSWAMYILLGVAFGLLTLLYLMDASAWKGQNRWLGYLPMLAIAAACLIAFCLLATADYPYAPLLCSFFLPITAVWAARRFLLFRVRPDAFFLALSRWLALLAALLAGTFATWAFAVPGWGTADWRAEFGRENATINMWQGDVKQYWRSKNGCEDERFPELVIYMVKANDCYTGAFLWWSFPLWIFFASCVYATIFFFLARTLQQAKGGSGKGGGGRDGGRRAQFAFRLFVSMIVFFMGVTWCAASVAGAGLGIARTVELAILLFVIVTTVVIGKTIGWSSVGATARSSPFYKKLSTYSEGFWDYLKAFAFWGLGWLVLAIYFTLSATKQACRKRLPFTLEPDSDGWLPKAAQGMLEKLKTWNWGSVLSKTTVWSIAYLVLQVIVMQVRV